MSSDRPSSSALVSRHALEAAIRIAVVALLVVWCFTIVRPFLVPVLWGGIIAIGVQPIFRRLLSLLGGRRKLAAVIFAVTGLALLLVPSFLLAESAYQTSQKILTGLEAGTLEVPPPSDSVAEWPLIGATLHDLWSQAAENLEEALTTAAPRLKPLVGKLLGVAAGLGSGLLQFAFSIVLAALFLAGAKGAQKLFDAIATRISPTAGSELVTIAYQTVTSVVQGVLGVALLQALMAAAGMALADVPGAGLWGVLVLVVAVAQLPPLLVLGPVAVWVFSKQSDGVAIAFLVWTIIVSMSDGFLKPLLLGRGVDVPMPVILLGAIGGMIVYGIIGLFVGATVLALAYRLFIGWLHLDDTESPEEKKTPAPPAVTEPG